MVAKITLEMNAYYYFLISLWDARGKLDVSIEGEKGNIDNDDDDDIVVVCSYRTANSDTKYCALVNRGGSGGRVFILSSSSSLFLSSTLS